MQTTLSFSVLLDNNLQRKRTILPPPPPFEAQFCTGRENKSVLPQIQWKGKGAVDVIPNNIVSFNDNNYYCCSI